MADERPLLPDYEGACITNIVPALLEPGQAWPTWIPAAAEDADQVVLLVLDGLGWEQLRGSPAAWPRRSAGLAGGPITTVAPSTTATALTSIATGLPPGEHGIVGYRMDVDGDVLNVLRWQAAGRDARASIPPDKVQIHEAFAGQRPPVVTRAEFRDTGFTAGPPRPHPHRRLAGHLHARHRGRPAAAPRRAVRLRLLRGHRQGGPRVRPRRVLRRRAPHRRRPRRRHPRRAAPRRGAGRHLRPRPGRRRPQHHHPGPRGHVPRRPPVRRGSLPLAPRPAGARPPPAGGGHRAPLRHRLGGVARPGRRRALVRPGRGRLGPPHARRRRPRRPTTP